MPVTRVLYVSLAVLTIALSASTGQASFGGEVSVTIDGQTFLVPVNFEPSTNLFVFTGDGTTNSPDGGSFTVEGTIDAGLAGSALAFLDPMIAYGIGVVDFGAPSTFGFLFGTPTIPVGTPNIVTSSLTGSLTDAAGNGVSLTPTGVFTQTSEVGFALTNMGVDIGAAESHPGSVAPGTVYAYGPYGAGPSAGPGPGPWTFLTVSASFDLSGGGDSASLSGSASIVPGTLPDGAVPEPLTAGLGALALAGLTLAFTRRRA